jgi:ABC-type nitrate/sulfonate/bicarbonate transport system ATPase subunit
MDAARGLVIDHVSFSFGSKRVLDSLSLTLDETPAVILGPSGCGKTTLLRLIAGLLPPQSGAIRFGNRAAGNGEETRVSFVFQEPRLLPHLSVMENITLPGRKHIPPDELRQKASRLLALTGLQNEARRYPDELSGGQSQRVSIARAFCYSAPLVLMDEPFQSLDLPLRLVLLETLKALLAAENRFLIAVTHDPREAVILGKRIIVLGKTGRVALDAANDNRDLPALEREILRGLTREQ